MVGEVNVGGESPGETPEEEPGGEETGMPSLTMMTDNGSVKVVVAVDKGTVSGDTVTLDQPEDVKFDLKFLDPTTGNALEHVNYVFMVSDSGGNMLAHKEGLHTHNGIDSQSVSFANTGSFELDVDVEGTGIDKPFDTAHSGSASSMIAVTPEFPLGIMAVMAAVVGVTVAATRFKSPFKL